MTAALRFPLRTHRLLLRPFTMDDLPAFSALYAREDVCRYLPWPPLSLDRSRAMLERIRTKVALGPAEADDGLRLAVVLPETGGIIGDVSIWRTSREHQLAEIGFVFHPDHHGQGFATEAMRVVIGLGFEAGGTHRIMGRCDARNTPSAALMERLGMRREAHLRENEYLKGEWTDELDYAILDREWTGARDTASRH
jgi:RimJ/RimL family protein N-acetyltransferase